LLGQVIQGLYKARQNELREVGIPMTHSEALWALKVLDGPVTPAMIGRMLSRRHQTVSELLRRMEKEGLVELSKSPGKKGRVNVTLTEKGEEAARLAWEREDVVAYILSCLQPEERENFIGYLTRLRSNSYGVVAAPRFP